MRTWGWCRFRSLLPIRARNQDSPCSGFRPTGRIAKTNPNGPILERSASAGCGVFLLRLRGTLECAGLDQLDAGLTHLIRRLVDIAGIEINPPATVRDDVGFDPQPDGVRVR